ncbi:MULTISPECIES: hypothetical protein [Thermomonosporaceae]|uniref:hypothetical protein n=1 Tax=Thermomonosporaceae TaxID=2012 RepID=UPI00255AB49E|nr:MULTISPECIES: hypothetical protein [Thermomonosporaceae]MDL4770601.1 hypothetical protein [Actinomadura xylanilytica]
MAGALSFGAPAPAEGSTLEEPKPRKSMPDICRQRPYIGDWNTAHICREAWLGLYGGPWAIPEHETATRKSHNAERTPESRHRPSRPHRTKRPPSPRRPPPPPRRPSRVPANPPTPVPVRDPEQADDPGQQAHSLQPLLFLGLLLPAAAAIGFPFRHRILTAAGTVFLASEAAAEAADERPVRFLHRPAIDPFALPALGLTGPGAADTARVIALAALEGYGDSALVVIPRDDATALFGLAEDELLDESTAQLFIPGNLDAALAYLETELAIRQGASSPGTRRLLLMADCEKEADRIHALQARHPSGMSAVLLGDWPADQITVDNDGLVETSPAVAGHLPERLPAMSRTEARDRLYATLSRDDHNQGTSGRRSKRGVKRT